MATFETIPPPDVEYLDVAIDPRAFVLGFTCSDDIHNLRDWTQIVAQSGICNFIGNDLRPLISAIKGV